MTQRKGTRDQRRGVDLAGAQESNGLREWPATRTDNGDLLDDDGPGFHRRRTVKRGFQHQCAPGLDYLLRKRQTRGRASGLNHEAK